MMEQQKKIRKLAMTAMLSAVSAVLMFISFNVPLMPGLLKWTFQSFRLW